MRRALAVLIVAAGLSAGAAEAAIPWTVARMEAWYAGRTGTSVTSVSCFRDSGDYTCGNAAGVTHIYRLEHGRPVEDFNAETATDDAAQPAPKPRGWPQLMTTDAVESFFEQYGLVQSRPIVARYQVLEISCTGQGYAGPKKLDKLGVAMIPTYRQFLCVVTTKPTLPNEVSLLHIDLTAAGPTVSVVG